MQDLYIKDKAKKILKMKDKAPLDISSTLGFALGPRYLNLTKTNNQWEESQHFYATLFHYIMDQLQLE